MCYVGVEQFKSTLWTAHGAKLIAADVDMSLLYDDNGLVSGLPSFASCVANEACDRLYVACEKLSYDYYDDAMCVKRTPGAFH